MYLVSDDYGNFKEIMNYKQLKELVINELVEEIKENTNEREIVVSEVNRLSFYAKNEVNIDLIEEDLKGFGWYITDILNIQRGINDLREYWARKHTDTKVFDDLLKFIDEDLK